MNGRRLLHLVRHGETVGQSSIRFWGSTDVALSDDGRRQVAGLGEVVARTLGTLRVAVVVHSPLVRASESARILGETLRLIGLPWHVEPDFAEIDFGAFEGLTAEEIRVRDPRWHAEWQARRHAGFPEGETLAGFDARVRTGFERALARTDGDILVVAHRGVIRRIADVVLPGQGEHPTELASLSTFELDPARVVRWNLRG